MSHVDNQYSRIIAISPSTKGFGFAVLEGKETLVGWGVKFVKKGNRNAQSLKKVKELVAKYKPETIVLEDCSAKGSRRRNRTRTLIQAIIDLASASGMNVALISRERVKRTFLPDGKGVKHDIAKILAERFPIELGHRLPPKREIWENKDSVMDMFDAAASVIMFSNDENNNTGRYYLNSKTDSA